MKLKSWLKYLNPRTYDFEDTHDREFAVFDSKVISIICLCVFIMMFGILVFVLLDPSVRYDSGMDNLPKLIIYSIIGFVGIIISSIKLKKDKYIYIRSNVARLYVTLLFLSLSFYSLVATNAKADAIFIYLMYCLMAIAILHINPILYTIQTIVYLLLTVNMVKEYYSSLGAMFSYIGIMFATIFIMFYNNISIRYKLAHSDKLVEHDKYLRDKLRNKQMEAINNQMELQDNIIVAIADLVENRDMDTGTHIKATAYYVKLIVDGAMAADIYPGYIDSITAQLIVKSAPMHDLGKISVPDYILKAPRRLTTEEFEIMKRHTIDGAEIIEHIYENIESTAFIQCASNIAKYHHERWDGTGYPMGISGQDIPIEARIMAIADVFDALTSKRCYKDSYPLSDAFTEIQRGAGTHFDPELVNIFMQYQDVIENMIVEGFRDS